MNMSEANQEPLAQCTAAERELLDKLATNDDTEELRAKVLLSRIPPELREWLILAMLASDAAYAREEALWEKVRGIRGNGRVGQRLHYVTLEKWANDLWSEVKARGHKGEPAMVEKSTPQIGGRPERPT